MKKELFSEIKNKIYNYVKASRLRDAFALCRQLAEGNMVWEITDRLNETEDSYRRLLSYVASGANDPERDKMTAEIGETILSITDSLERLNNRRDDPALYYSMIRYRQTASAQPLVQMLADYRKQCSESSLFDMLASGNHSQRFVTTAAEREAAEREIFNALWTEFPLGHIGRDTLRDFLTDGVVPEYAVSLFVWAIVLGGLEFYDPVRLEILCEIYLNGSSRNTAIALVGLMILLYKWRNRRLSTRLSNLLATVREHPDWPSDVRTVYMELTRTRDTDRISAKIRDEIVPEMMKLRPDIERKFSNPSAQPFNPEELEENPEWQEIIEQSGLGDKLKEMSEIQEEGGDIMMGTFQHLKSFPFFHEIANWFIPFHSERSEFAGVGSEGLKQVAAVFENLQFLCDSDKYSALLSLAYAPAAQRDMALSQLNAQADQFNEMRAASLETAHTDRRDIIRRQVQNLYRFFHLFRRKNEFDNPFELGIHLVDVPVLAQDVRDTEMLTLIGEFYFSHGYWEEALTLFARIDELTEPSAALYQKTGHALMKLGRTSAALSYFEKADMLDNRSPWTLTRLGRCNAMLGHHSSALSAYERLDELQRGKPSTALAIGHAHLALRHYPEAIKAFYKALYLDEKSGKALRPLAWSLMMDKQFDQARKYYERIVSDFQPRPDDYLNMGHLALASGQIAEASNFYRLSILSRPQPAGVTVAQGEVPRANIEAFIADMTSDTDAITALGISPALIPLIIDSLIYTL